MKRFVYFVLSSLVAFALPQVAKANVSSLPHIETSIAGEYPEVSTGVEKIGLDLEIRFGDIGNNNSEKFYTTVDSSRKLSVPDLRFLSKTDLKNLMPISVTFSVPSPNFNGSELGRHYLSWLKFNSVQEYQNFFGGPLSVFFRYISHNPIAVKVSTLDGSPFADWYHSNINAKECLFATVKLLNPQSSQYGADLAVQVGPTGFSEQGAFFVLRANQDINYKVTLFSSSNPYVCGGMANASSSSSLSHVIVEKTYSLKSVDFPNTISVSVP